MRREIYAKNYTVLNVQRQRRRSYGILCAETQDDIDHYYDKLSEGGKHLACGWLKDKFGVSWQVTPPILMNLLADPDREKADRVTQAMFKMSKIIIADLEAAAK